jgi:hypothetical protein
MCKSTLVQDIPMEIVKTAMTMGIGMTESFGLVQAGTMDTGLQMSLLSGPGVEITTGADMDMAGIMVDTMAMEAIAEGDIMAADTMVVEVIAAAAGTMAEAITAKEYL